MPWTIDNNGFLKFVNFERGPWTLTPERSKAYYNEGTSIQSYRSPLFTPSLETSPDRIEWPDTGDKVDPRVKITDEHKPCGYWHIMYEEVPPERFSSWTYDLEEFEDMEVKLFEVTSGEFRAILRSIPPLLDEMEIQDFQTYSGVFRAILRSIEPVLEEMEIQDHEVNAGVFKQILYDVSDQDEEAMEIKFSVVWSGVFRDALIEYEDGLPEEMEIQAMEVYSGVHSS